MGRSAGFIAVHATMASGDVDLCLVPEVSIELDGEFGILRFLQKRLAQQGHAVIVVAEGAGEEILGKSAEVDAGGNRKLPAIGVRIFLLLQSFLKQLQFVQPFDIIYICTLLGIFEEENR